MKKLGITFLLIKISCFAIAQLDLNNSWQTSIIESQPAFYSNFSGGSHWLDLSTLHVRNRTTPIVDAIINGNIPIMKGNIYYMGQRQTSLTNNNWFFSRARLGYCKGFIVGEFTISTAADLALNYLKNYNSIEREFNMNYGLSVDYRNFRILGSYIKNYSSIRPKRYFAFAFIGNHEFEKLRLQYGLEYYEKYSQANLAIQYRSFKAGLGYSVVFSPISHLTSADIFTRLGWHGEKLCLNYSFTPNIFFREGNPFIQHNITMGFYLNGNSKGVPLF